MITLFHIYYGQTRMLNIHSSAWLSHKDLVNYCIIDDASQWPAKELAHPRLKIYRIQEDIPWNIAGARNLGFYAANTEWVLGADIDHVVTQEALEQIVKLDMSDPNKAYIFKRRTKDGYIGCEAIINILMNKEKYFDIGGYDEDFSGAYGKEETFFLWCLKRHRIQLIKPDIILDWYPRLGGTHSLSRDTTRNKFIFEEKMKLLDNGVYTNGSILRYSWRLVEPSI